MSHTSHAGSFRPIAIRTINTNAAPNLLEVARLYRLRAHRRLARARLAEESPERVDHAANLRLVERLRRGAAEDLELADDSEQVAFLDRVQ